MDVSPAPSRADALTRWYGPVAASLVARALALLAAFGAVLTRAEHTAAARQVRAAETLARRLALLVATDLDTAPRAPRARPAAAVRLRRSLPSRHTLPMFDPWRPRPQPDWAAIRARRNPDLRVPSRRLHERARAAEAVARNPERLARRMAAWVRRREAREQAEITDRSRPEWAIIVRHGRLPCGLAHLCRSARDALRTLQQAARAAYRPLPSWMPAPA